MLLLVEIALSNADVDLFEAYEQRVLGLLGSYGAMLHERLRSRDGLTETHLIEFPDADTLARYQADPARVAAQDLWRRSRASSNAQVVFRHP